MKVVRPLTMTLLISSTLMLSGCGGCLGVKLFGMCVGLPFNF